MRKKQLYVKGGMDKGTMIISIRKENLKRDKWKQQCGKRKRKRKMYKIGYKVNKKKRLLRRKMNEHEKGGKAKVKKKE